MKESFSHFKRAHAAERVPEQTLSPYELEEAREEAFDWFILRTLDDVFQDHLSEAGFSDEAIGVVMDAIEKLPFKEAASVLGVPRSIAVRKFSTLLKEVQEHRLRPEDIPARLLAESKERGFGIGYHNATHAIRPDPKSGDWFIKPTQQDHRDGDLPRAYFATSYKTLYRSKHALNFLYIVRTIGDTSKTDGNWSRTNGLSVIAEVPLDKVDSWVQNAILSRQREKQGAVAAYEERRAA